MSIYRLPIRSLAVFLISVLFLFSNAFSDEKRSKIIFLPFNNNSDTNVYANSGIFRDIFSRSLYAFIRDYPNKNSLNYDFVKEKGVTSLNIQPICDKESARFAVYGNYRFEGDKSKPKIFVDLSVFDAASGTNIFNKGYRTATGQTVFNDIDIMIAEVMKSTLVDYPNKSVESNNKISNTTIVSQVETNKSPSLLSNASEPKEYPRLHASVLTLDFDIATFLVEYFPINRNFWVGAGAGYSMMISTNAFYTFLSPMIETGYLLIGDMQQDFRVGAGYILRFNFVLSSGESPPFPNPNLLLFNTGLLINLDYKIFTIRPEILLNFGNNGQPGLSFTVAAGLHF